MCIYNPNKGRVIFHIDANAFFASVEMAEDPSLQNKPVIVAGNPAERKGIVVAANYLCKKRGVYTTMPLWKALKIVPEAIVKKPNHKLYKAYSVKIFDFLTAISPIIEVASIDEAYVDVTHCQYLGSPIHIAQSIQRDILHLFNIPVSIGIAPNKFLAKMASDMQKPLGITVLRKRDIERVLWDKPVQDTYGIGKKTAEKLHEHGIATIGDLAKADVKWVESILGFRGIHLHGCVNGTDGRPVNPDANTSYKSIGNSTTFPENITAPSTISDKMKLLSSMVSERMKQKKVVSRTIQIMIRYGNFKTITRSQTIEKDIWNEEDILYHAEKLFYKHWNGDPVRLIGITAQNVIKKNEMTTQLDIFSFAEEAGKVEPLMTAVDELKRKFGESIIKKGSEL
ncbi:DNA polymerase IV [Domibacillus epiphyticus]|uniref:DNA polymerase IV n=1 Tax=Domibacillus epiphyticus TaxID=1714355 RepID=UPI0026CBA787